MSPIKLESAQALRRPKRRVSPLLAALLLSFAFWASCAVYTAPEKGTAVPQEKTASVRFTQLVPEGAGSVQALAYQNGEERFVLFMQDGVPVLEGEDAALDPRAAQELLGTGASILSRQKLPGSPADYGVGENALRAEYRYESGEVLTLLVGDPVPTGEGVYAAVAGEDGVHVVNNALSAALRVGKQALYALPDLSERFTANTLLSAEIALPGQQGLTLERVTQDNPFNTKVQMTSPILYPANAERAAEVYLALEKIQPTGVAQIGGRDEDWGLAQPLAVLTLRDREETTLTVGQAEGVYTLRISGDENVYTVDGANLSFLDVVSVPYLAEQLPGLVMLNQVSRIDVHAGEETLVLTADQDAGAFALDGKPLTAETFVPAYQQMIGLLIERYVPEPETVGVPRIRIDYTFKDGGSWSIAFAQYDEQYDLVVRGDCACFLISRAKTDAMLEALRGLK